MLKYPHTLRENPLLDLDSGPGRNLVYGCDGDLVSEWASIRNLPMRIGIQGAPKRAPSNKLPLPLVDEGRKRVLGIMAAFWWRGTSSRQTICSRPAPAQELSPWWRLRFRGRSASCGRWPASLPASDHTTGPFSRMHISAIVLPVAQGESPASCHPRSRLRGASCRPSRAWDRSCHGC
jgi:hypothetical protein